MGLYYCHGHDSWVITQFGTVTKQDYIFYQVLGNKKTILGRSRLRWMLLVGVLDLQLDDRQMNCLGEHRPIYPGYWSVFNLVLCPRQGIRLDVLFIWSVGKSERESRKE